MYFIRGGTTCVDDLTHGYYNYSYKSLILKDEYIEFKVYTSKLRIFVGMHNLCNQNNNHDIYIDEVLITSKSSYINIIEGTTTGQRLLFEKTDMSKEIHKIKIINNEDGQLLFDCIDIDTDGYLPTRTYHGIGSIGLIKTINELIGKETIPLESDISDLKNNNKLLSFTNINSKIQNINEPYKIVKTTAIDETKTARYIDYNGITYELALQINKDDPIFHNTDVYNNHILRNTTLLNDTTYKNNENCKYRCYIDTPFNKLIFELNEVSLHLDLDTTKSSLMQFLSNRYGVIPSTAITETIDPYISPFGLSRIKGNGIGSPLNLVTNTQTNQNPGGYVAVLGFVFSYYGGEGIGLAGLSSGVYGYRATTCFANAKLYIALA